MTLGTTEHDMQEMHGPSGGTGTSAGADEGGAVAPRTGPATPSPGDLVMRDEPAEAPRLVWRLRLVAVVLGLAAVCFRQSPGLVVPDTKLDLTAAPGAFLARALHLWDPQGALGQLQNQAYGYLFPVGPFHLLLTSAGLPAWVVQRLWWTTIMTVALLGMWRLTRVLGVTTPWARLIAAALYALGPRVLSEIAITSVEVWPLALAPWVLAPLVDPSLPTRSKVARSALAFAFVGGVNAVASGAVLVLPALWIVTRRWSWSLLRLAMGWAAAVVVVSAWWMAPLLVLGRHSAPFLQWIEDASVTTSTASPFEALRGTSAWLGFLATSNGPSWPGAWLLVTQPLLIVATTSVAVFGLVGIALRRTPHRGFLALGVVVGLALVTLGTAAPGGGMLAETIRHALDGPLAPLRNTHKFELVVRIPLLVGLAHLLARAPALASTRRFVLPARARTLLPAVLAASLVVVAVAPAFGTGLARPEGYRAIPTHWRQAASWLDAQPGDASVLVAPAASFSDLTWGSTKDEPLQALTRRPFVVRDAVPLGSAGATRLLDVLEDRLASGRRVEGLAAVLARAGVGYVLVRNEIRLDAQGAPPLAVTRALVESGLKRAAAFGPPAGAYGESETLTVDYRSLVQRPAIEIWAVPGPTQARLVPTADLARVTGGPENLLELAAAGHPDALLGSDAAVTGTYAPGGQSVLTDGLRRREMAFGRAADNASGLLAPTDPGRSGRRVIDYDSDPAAGRTTLAYAGVRGVTASTSASDATATLRLGPGSGPAAAVDGDVRTRWVSGGFGRAKGEWLRLDFDRATDVTGSSITLSAASPIAAKPSVVRVDTAAGTEYTEVFAGPSIRLLTPRGSTSWLKVSLAEVAPGPENGFAVSELHVPGVQPGPAAVLPPVRGTPDSVLIEEGLRGRSQCLAVSGTSWCSPTLSHDPEESGWSRTWGADESATYRASGTVRPLDGPALERLLALPSGVRATASSRLVTASAGRPDAGIDDDPGTGWVAGVDDPSPWYEVRLPQRRTVSGLAVARAAMLPASAPVELHIRFDDGTAVTRRVDSAGQVRFPPRRTRTLHITFGDVRLLTNIDSATGRRTFAPVGFSELALFGAEDLHRALAKDQKTGVPCGFGPTVEVNGRPLLTSVSGRVGDIVSGRALRWRVCSEKGWVATHPGTTTLRVRATAEFAPEQLRLVRSVASVRHLPVEPLTVVRPSGAEARLVVPERSVPTALVLSQNFNTGWTASTADGKQLTPVRVGGWQQGFFVPAGLATTVVARFEPDDAYRTGLGVGAALLVLGLAAGGLLARRRVERPGPAAAVGVPLSNDSAGVLACVTALGVTVVAGGFTAVAAVVVAGATVLLAGSRGRRAHEGGRPHSRQAGVWAAVGRGAVLLLASAPVIAALVDASDPWPVGRLGVGGWGVQAAVWLAVAASVWVALARGWRIRRPRTRRTKGRSRDR